MMKMTGRNNNSRAGIWLVVSLACFSCQLQAATDDINGTPASAQKTSAAALASGSIFEESTAVMADATADKPAEEPAHSATEPVQNNQSPYAYAAANKPVVPVQSNKTGAASHLASVAVGLLLILGLIFALAWVVKRFNQGGMFNNSAIKIVAAIPLGTRERLMVVDVAGQQILLGVTATQVNTLHVFADPVIDANNTATSSEFSRKLFAALQQKATPGSAIPDKPTSTERS